MSAPTLSRSNAVATAVAILDVEGAGALTMRRVAREMGVPLMSLYRHVSSKDDLDGAIVQALIAGLPAPAAGASGTWQRRLRAWAAAYRDMLVRHPNAAPLLAARPAVAYGARLGDVELALRQLGEAGLGPTAARVQLRAAIMAIAGFCTTQSAAQAAMSADGTEWSADIDHPRASALVDDVRSGRHADRVFRAMVDGVVAAVEAAIAAGTGPVDPRQGAS